MGGGTAPPALQALIVDYGGVLTNPLGEVLAGWCAADDIDPAEVAGLLRQWQGRGGAQLDRNPVHELETGELAGRDFEVELAARLHRRDGGAVDADGLLDRMFAGFRGEPSMTEALVRARAAGLRTALLSNSWGNDYPREGWDALFDVVVISGEVGLRKPDAAIYALTAERLGLPPQACVFVDDLAPNVRGAAAAGMVGVHHTDAAETLRELETLLGVRLT